MSANAATITPAAELKDLYAPLPTLAGCRTCGIMGWDQKFQGR